MGTGRLCASRRVSAGRRGGGESASDDMITFVVLNTASIQLIPTTIAGLRAKYGSLNPMDIMPAIWLASAIALVAGQIINRILAAHAERRRRPCR